MDNPRALSVTRGKHNPKQQKQIPSSSYLGKTEQKYFQRRALLEKPREIKYYQRLVKWNWGFHLHLEELHLSKKNPPNPI